MRLLFKTAKFVVYDDVLSQEDFMKVYAYASEEHYAAASGGGNSWLKVWRCGDTTPLAGPGRFTSQGPFNLPIDIVSARLRKLLGNILRFASHSRR